VKKKNDKKLLTIESKPILTTLISQQEEDFNIGKLKKSDTEMSVFTDLETPNDEALNGTEYQKRFSDIPLQPMFHHKDGQSHVGTSLFDGTVALKSSDLNSQSILLNVSETKWNGMLSELKQSKVKIATLENENKYAIESKLQLLDKTSTEINKLRQIVNAILDVNAKQNNVSLTDAIKQMLKTSNG
jgi:hypothetical protein